MSVQFLFIIFLTRWGISYCDNSDTATTIHEKWEIHKGEHNLTFDSPDDHDLRKELFTQKDVLIEDQNIQNLSYTLRHNKFSHMTEEEREQHRGLNPPSNLSRTETTDLKNPNYLKQDKSNIPLSLDYRTTTCVGPIKDQDVPHLCGCCWAFSAIAPVEFSSCRNNGNVYVPLSEQQLIDCDDYYDNGCYGGWPANGWYYLYSYGGSVTSSSYPFTAVQNYCKASYSRSWVEVYYYNRIAPGNVNAMKSALVKYGPLSVAIYASPSFEHWSSGVFTATDCDNGKVNHAVVIVGWDQDSISGIPYWIVRNSWGINVGNKGYYYVQLGVNKCNIESYAYYVITS